MKGCSVRNLGYMKTFALSYPDEQILQEVLAKLTWYHNLKTSRDDPTIGIILCKSKDRTIVEYALQGVQKPIGVSTFQVNQLPETLRQNLPTVEQLEMELNTVVADTPEAQDD